jgi:uncharacterized membrane protein
MISGLEEEQEGMKGLAPTLWKMVVAWGFRLAVVTGVLLLTLKFIGGLHPFDRYYLHWKLAFVTILVAMSELSARSLARSRRGAPLLALLMFLLATFVVVNGSAFGQKPSIPAEVSANPAS